MTARSESYHAQGDTFSNPSAEVTRNPAGLAGVRNEAWGQHINKMQALEHINKLPGVESIPKTSEIDGKTAYGLSLQADNAPIELDFSTNIYGNDVTGSGGPAVHMTESVTILPEGFGPKPIDDNAPARVAPSDSTDNPQPHTGQIFRPTSRPEG